MKIDKHTLPQAQFATFAFALKALRSDLRTAESALAFELAMLELERFIEMVESMEWP